MIPYQGEIAALLTALCWCFNSVVFSLAGKRVGSVTVNYLRIWIAFVSLIILHLFIFQSPFPFDISSQKLFYLAFSGVIGFIIGDGLLFEAFVRIGPRLAMLLMLLTPIFSACLAWIFLGEHLLFWEIVAIAVTMAGIGGVVSEARDKKEPNSLKTSSSSESSPSFNPSPRNLKVGFLLGLGGAAGQAIGLLFSKMGLEGGVSPISANHVRVTAAAILMLLFVVARKKLGFHLKKMRDKKTFIEITTGSLSGPVLGVILSLIAIKYTHIGVAATLMSISPILLIPVSHFLFGERITLRAIIGTIIALLGSLSLFFL
jgi:drug/metabolite transporter (DMT)-like permease